MTTGSRIELKVGLFVFIAILIGSILVFTIGSQNNLFIAQTKYETLFTDVVGLRAGSPVRMAGMNVGTVTDIDIGDEGKIHVIFGVREDKTRFIREGSVVSIGSKGMLGDQLLEITVGRGKPIPPNGRIMSVETTALSHYMKQAGRLLSAAESTADNILTGTEALGDPQFGEDIRKAASDVSTVLSEIAEGDGLLNRLIMDARLARSVEETVRNLQATSERLSGVSENVQAITRQIRNGKGLVSKILYDPEGSRIIDELASATSEVSTMLDEIRHNDSTVHRLLYTDDATDLLANLTQISEDLKAVSNDIRRGRGTLGGLLSDPSLYEDLKRLVGNLQRNEILRALVRYSIKKDETQSRTEVETSR
ncbi:MAG: MCE family protein [Deltaproteobacteria bacterium]|nr:MCE family protein [Deltaproteobacteria bacterium]